MYKLMVRRLVRRTLARLSRGEYEHIVGKFRPPSRFMFAGNHELGGERRGPDEARAWFQHMLRRFPGIQIVPREIVVNGWPWITVVATHLVIAAPRAGGREYRNEGMQFLRLSWGRIVEDLIFEDTLALEEELRRTSHSGEREPLAGSSS
jgi:ketosteroid isomerase-like protein